MASGLTIRVRREDKLKQFPEISSRVLGDTMTTAIERVLGDAQKLSPVDRGFFRSSLDVDVRTNVSPLQVVGRIFATAQHSLVIEGVDAAGKTRRLGRQPGTFPPVDVMRAWVRRVLGIRGDEVARVAFLVSRAIARRGIKAKRPMREALNLNKDWIRGLFRDQSSRLARALEGR